MRTNGRELVAKLADGLTDAGQENAVARETSVRLGESGEELVDEVVGDTDTLLLRTIQGVLVVVDGGGARSGIVMEKLRGEGDVVPISNQQKRSRCPLAFSHDSTQPSPITVQART